MMHIKCNENISVGNLKKLTQATLQVKGLHAIAEFHITHLLD